MFQVEEEKQTTGNRVKKLPVHQLFPALVSFSLPDDYHSASVVFQILGDGGGYEEMLDYLFSLLRTRGHYSGNTSTRQFNFQTCGYKCQSRKQLTENCLIWFVCVERIKKLTINVYKNNNLISFCSCQSLTS